MNDPLHTCVYQYYCERQVEYDSSYTNHMRSLFSGGTPSVKDVLTRKRYGSPMVARLFRASHFVHLISS